jgi:anti-anti-sigma factor
MSDHTSSNERNAHIETSRRGPVGHVRLAGAIDIACRPELIRALEDALTLPEIGEVIIDLRQVELVDSTALGILVAAEKRARALDIRLFFCKGPPAAHRPFEMTNIDQYLTFIEA